MGDSVSLVHLTVPLTLHQLRWIEEAVKVGYAKSYGEALSLLQRFGDNQPDLPMLIQAMGNGIVAYAIPPDDYQDDIDRYLRDVNGY